jgi:hypothetical protein
MSENQITFSIRIVNEDGEGISGVRVYVLYRLTEDTEYTDDDGWAHFTKVGFDASLMQSAHLGEVKANGKTLDEDVSVDNGETLSYTLTDD